jgi:hypothetical protein
MGLDVFEAVGHALEGGMYVRVGVGMVG